MKITAGFWLLVWFGVFTHPSVVSAQEEATDKAVQGAQTQEEQTVPTPAAPEQTGAVPTAPEPTGAVPTAPEEDYTAYIRPLDKLRAELSQQQALLEIVVAITAQIDQLRNQESHSDILVLLDEDLSQAERIKAVLSNNDHAQVDELAVIRTEIEFLKSMYIQTLQVRENSAVVTIDTPVPWALGPSSIEYVQATDSGAAGFVSVTTAAGNRVVIKANESITIAGQTILLDSVKLGPDGRILIHFVVDGKLETVYYPQ